MRRVLVCDDDISISEVVAIVLTDSKLGEVYTLPDCDNIIEQIDTIKPSVIFMDDKIPTDGGVKATRLIKNHPEHKNIPVIYFTANNDIHILAEKAGANYTLAKPFNISQLEDVVQQAFRGFQDPETV
ncbi:response regulator [Daejeonella oryzae]|uniref:response regulator n=1 Tax=Daejeonella oryzae TaxID=1122943 RepID=UPI0003FDC3FA|nr:response regulator [Daejeonella oryzae]